MDKKLTEEQQREYWKKTPQRILDAFEYDNDESRVRFRQDPKTGEIVIHTSNRFAHALLEANALRQEHNDETLKFDVGSQKDDSIQNGWHYRIAIKGDENALKRVYKSMQLLSQHQDRFVQYGEIEPTKPIEPPKKAKPTPTPTPLKEEDSGATFTMAAQTPKSKAAIAPIPAPTPEKPAVKPNPRTPLERTTTEIPIHPALQKKSPKYPAALG